MASIEIIERKKEWTNEADHWKHLFNKFFLGGWEVEIARAAR
jgi:hypothetical protein